MNLNLTLSNIRLVLTVLSIFVLFGNNALAADKASAAISAESSNPPVFARVGKDIITQNQYDAAYAAASRNRFYHGKPPEAEVAALQREISDKLINDVLLLNEAKRLKLKPDNEEVKQKLEKYEQRNASNTQWQKIRDRALPVLTKRYQDESLRNQLEKQTRKVPSPNEKQLRAYYNAHPEKFTEPKQLRVSVILLSVDPGLPTWDATRKTAEDLVKQLREGADFAEMAKLRSGDAESAGQGGDMGYQHSGMMSEMSEQAVDKLKPGEISDPVNLMEGIAIFKLTERKDPVLKSLDEVKQRARELYLTDESERAWKSLVVQLRKKTSVTVDESRFLPLPNSVTAAPTKPVALPENKTTGEAAAPK